MEKYSLEFKVRDYECDIQGIVNNANYQHFLEHARHEFIKTLGVSFSGLHEQGVDFVVARIEMSFKTPLKSGDDFMVTVEMKKEGIRWVFLQDILRLCDNKLVVRAKVDSVSLVNGKLTDYKPFDTIFGKNNQ
jgi:acyl-CoA thioester hydrolase